SPGAPGAPGAPGVGEPSRPDLFAGFDASVFARLLAGEVGPGAPGGASTLAEFDFIGLRFSLDANAYALIFTIAFVAGFLLNLTPCVLPVIPLKVLSLQKQANNPAKLALFGSVYCVGIVATFVVLGLLILGIRVGAEKQDWGQIFSSPVFAMAMAVIVGVMGLGMMGLFTIRLPKAVYMVNPAGDTVQGNFMMGVLTAILSTPCTGPFLGATVAWAVTQPKWVGMTAFIVMGLGMAFPYALLILFPKLIDRMPRSGPGGELLKQVLGLVLLAVAAFLASNVTSAKWPWYIVGGLAGLAFLWAIVGGWRVLRKTSGKLIVTAVGVLGIAGTTLATRSLTSEGPVPWVYYSPDAFAKARAEGKTVVLKFTAKWCTNCHVIEKSILNANPARDALNARNVVPMKVDLTLETNEEGWSKLREVSGGSGIPLTAIYLPGEPEPVIFRSFYGADALIEVLDSAAAPAR
ncbi:MAG: thioredoxin family protein, partial [Phycisphaerales bacterium]|nr:thioredoxin family protein [Phycisphaerales bacterium]